MSAANVPATTTVPAANPPRSRGAASRQSTAGPWSRWPRRSSPKRRRRRRWHQWPKSRARPAGDRTTGARPRRPGGRSRRWRPVPHQDEHRDDNEREARDGRIGTVASSPNAGPAPPMNSRPATPTSAMLNATGSPSSSSTSSAAPDTKPIAETLMAAAARAQRVGVCLHRAAAQRHQCAREFAQKLDREQQASERDKSPRRIDREGDQTGGGFAHLPAPDGHVAGGPRDNGKQQYAERRGEGLKCGARLAAKPPGDDVHRHVPRAAWVAARLRNTANTSRSSTPSSVPATGRLNA